MEESYRNELQLQKLNSNIQYKSYVSAIIRNSDNNKEQYKVTKENNTTDDAAVFRMETHTSMNGTQKSVSCW